MLFAVAIVLSSAGSCPLSSAFTRRLPALGVARTPLPLGMSGVYQITRCVQLDATAAGFFVNLRQDKTSGFDVEIGTDFCFTRDPKLRNFEGFQPIARAEVVDPAGDGSRFLMVSYPMFPAFVPLGAKLADGSPHPHAGTGFAVAERLGRPCDANGKCYGKGYVNPLKDKRHDDVEIVQLAWDGKKLSVTLRESVGLREFAGELTQAFDPMSGCVPDGADLLLAWCRALPGEKIARPGVVRWRRTGGKWRIAAFTPVGAPGGFEPSLVRDRDGTLLFTYRTGVKEWFGHLFKTTQGAMEDTVHARDIRVWRSEDNGVTWHLALMKEDCCNAAPISIVTAADGTPLVVTNARADTLATGGKPFHGGIRERLVAWPLTADRTDLLPSLLVRDANAEFGRAPYGTGWYLDHPCGLVLRLGDQCWHSVICYRNLDMKEAGGVKSATEFTGAYVEEITLGKAAVPVWKF